MECPFCKEEIKDGAIKCKHCGAMLADQASMAHGANLSTEQKILASDVTEKKQEKVSRHCIEHSDDELFHAQVRPENTDI